MENHHFQLVNQRTKWPFSIAMLNDQRVNHNAIMFCGLANVFETNSNPRRGQDSDDIIKHI